MIMDLKLLPAWILRGLLQDCLGRKNRMSETAEPAHATLEALEGFSTLILLVFFL